MRKRNEQWLLSIDTTGDRMRVVLQSPAATKSRRASAHTAHDRAPAKLLRMIDRLLADVGADRGGITRMMVVPGPGRFSVVRLGVATANALAWALRVPLYVDGVRVTVAQPLYGSPPHIS